MATPSESGFGQKNGGLAAIIRLFWATGIDECGLRLRQKSALERRREVKTQPGATLRQKLLSK